jgi:hypothetical protein
MKLNNFTGVYMFVFRTLSKIYTAFQKHPIPQKSKILIFWGAAPLCGAYAIRPYQRVAVTLRRSLSLGPLRGLARCATPPHH